MRLTGGATIPGSPAVPLQLTFRTFNRDFDNPNHNDDDLACLLRDQLMPQRGRLHRERATQLLVRAWLLQFPCLGIPGIVNFVDVRTQWFDGAVKRAIADGFKQVVILAAGYDTRAYRLAAKGVRFYEVDLPHASETKQRLVEQLLPHSKVWQVNLQQCMCVGIVIARIYLLCPSAKLL
jgi:methyltransferase (TIGR00027 family)